MIDLLTPKSILPNLRANSKKQALQELARRAAELTGQHERAVFDVLLERWGETLQEEAARAAACGERLLERTLLCRS